ncbi:MAG: glycosyltransferase [Tepidisphaeraceae bacterium]|jgi:cellulose synthase (UDP-forming)
MASLHLFLFTLLALAFFLLVAPSLPKNKVWPRAVMVGLTLSIMLRYLVWRWCCTVWPDLFWSLGGLWSFAVFAAESAALLSCSITYLILTRPTNRSAEADAQERRLRRLPLLDLPSVDVFIPTYNEGKEVLERTIVAATHMDYPNYCVWILDDGRREWLKTLCAERRVGYLTRDDNKHAKAGNVNNALRHTSGEFIAIFDADFAPMRQFIFRTLGFFDNPKIGIVQTPQHFFNRDPLQRNLGLGNTWPDEQRLFFDTIQPARDGWGVAFCCGSCCMLRRSAVEAIGGIPTGSVTEDVLTTLALLRRGIITRYLNERLSMGLAPESVGAYFVQRKRWLRGGIQLLFLRQGPLGPGLSPLQRLTFIPFEWLVMCPMRLFALMIPLVYLLTGLSPFHVPSLQSLLDYQVPTYVAMTALMCHLARSTYMPVLTAAIGLFNSFRMTPTLISSLIKPFGVPFRVTPKGKNIRRKDDQKILWAAGALIGANFLGISINQIPWLRIVGGDDFLLLAVLFALMNTILLALTMLMACEREQGSEIDPFPCDRPVDCIIGGTCVPSRLMEISTAEAWLEFPDQHLFEGEAIQLILAGVGILWATVAGIREKSVRVAFTTMGLHERTRLITWVYTFGLHNGVEKQQTWEVTKRLARAVLKDGSRARAA